MKKVYLSALAIGLVVGVNAQINQTYQEAPKHVNFGSDPAVNNGSLQKAIIWSNDFSDASQWTIVDNLGGQAVWEIVTDPDAVPNNGPAAMTTVANGYALINSDAAGNGQNQDTEIIYNGSIDCSGQPNVTMEFEQNYRIYQDQRYVLVSNDSTNWTTYTITDGSTGSGDNVSGVESINISAVAGNQATVYIKFKYVGSFGWHWAVDDINVKSTEPYDLRADKTVWGTNGSYGATLPYYGIPSNQVQPITFCGIASNIGLNNVADATFSIDIPSFYTSASSGTFALAADSSDTICAVDNFTPAASVATYTATSSISTPGNTDTGVGNESFPDITFEVTSNVYARDNMQAGIQGGTYNSGNGFESGNIFDIFTTDNIYGVDVVIGSTAVEGAQIFVKLYSIDSEGNFVQEALSDYYSVTAADLGNMVTIPFLAASSGGFTLTGGESYLVVVGTDGDGGNSNDLVVGTAGKSEAQTTFYYDATDATWYYSTSTPMVRMNFDETLNVEESVLEGVSIYPNPTSGVINVSNELLSDNTIEVRDLTGKVIATTSASTATTIDLTGNAAGVYIVKVSNENGYKIEKVTLK